MKFEDGKMIFESTYRAVPVGLGMAFVPGAPHDVDAVSYGPTCFSFPGSKSPLRDIERMELAVHMAQMWLRWGSR